MSSKKFNPQRIVACFGRLKSGWRTARKRGRRPGRQEAIEILADVMLAGGVPECLRSDNSAEFVAGELRK